MASHHWLHHHTGLCVLLQYGSVHIGGQLLVPHQQGRVAGVLLDLPEPHGVLLLDLPHYVHLLAKVFTKNNLCQLHLLALLLSLREEKGRTVRKRAEAEQYEEVKLSP